MNDLVERLEAAECGHYGLDDAVWIHCGLILPHPNGAHTHLPPVTTSLDAALALAERVLPGFGFFLRKDKDGCNCGLVYPDGHFVTPGCGQAPTPAIAMCIAILKALNPEQSHGV